MVDLIVVGSGDHYNHILGPSIELLEEQGHVRLIATLDIRPLRGSSRTPHLIRKPDQPLSEMLRQFKHTDPIVYLAHAHTCHTKDALDLARAGFQVAVEKPYAISSDELNQLTKCLETSRVFLAEYYLMMKAAPLLHAFKMLSTDSFLRCEPGFLIRGPAAPLLDSTDLWGLIGGIRSVYVDILEGEGDTGRFEHRGYEYADRRQGGGIIMDLGVHAFAPLAAIAPLIGDLAPDFNGLVSARSEDFLRYAQGQKIPLNEIPETYSSVSMVSSIEVPITIAVAKYSPRNRNQRRLILIGDEGEAILDMSSCALYIAHGDACPTLAWQIVKNPTSKYVPVLRVLLEEAQKRPQFTFNCNKVCLKSQELTLAWQRTSSLSCPSLPTYPIGSGPIQIREIIKSSGLKVKGSAAEAPVDHEGAKLYYEHQYDRTAALEDQAFKMSAGVLVLTAAVFTFASRVGNDSFLPWKTVIVIMALANLAAIIYTWRAKVSARGHQKRAKAVLEKMWPEMWAVDQRIPIPLDKVQLRSWTMMALHFLLVVLAAFVLYQSAHQRAPAIEKPPTVQQPANRQAPPTSPRPVQQEPKPRTP